MKLWQIIERRWTTGYFSTPGCFRDDKQHIHETAKNDILDLIEYIRELEGTEKEVEHEERVW